MDLRAVERRVASAGVFLCVREYGAAAAGVPTVVLVHGYPDSQEVWDAVVAELDRERLHLVTYDVRGAGGSEAPAGVEGYRTDLLLEDLLAVVSATVPEGGRFHLVGHDWGSVQLWDAVAAERTDPRLTGRIASFTSISGPPLDHIARVTRRREGRQLRLLGQAFRSWYVYAFHVPGLPTAMWTLVGGVNARLPFTSWGPGLTRDARNGVNLYRANILPRMRRPRRLWVDVPVQVVHPVRDPFISEVLLEDLDEVCRDVRIEPLDSGHWVMRSRPAEVARLVTEHVERHAGG